MLKTSRLVLLTIPALALSACSQTFPVSGQIGRSGEAFIGTATSSLSGEGIMRINTDTGTKCEGKYHVPVVFTPTEGAMGSGGFQCTDGRTGTFSFAGDTIRGEGFGKMNNGDKLNFLYGTTSIVKVR